jgi:hypothetical protein
MMMTGEVKCCSFDEGEWPDASAGWIAAARAHARLAPRFEHAERYPDGCDVTWERMCEACCERLDAYPHEAGCGCDKCADDAAGHYGSAGDE